MININELSERTGLRITFIRKCLNILNDVLDPYIQRGDFNKILFDSSGVVIFDKIKQLKDDGLSIPEIRKNLEKTIKSNQNVGIKVDKTSTQSGDGIDLFDKVLELHQQVVEEKEKRIKDYTEKDIIIKELEKKNQELTSMFKLLPEGKTPEQIKEEWELEQKRKLEVAKVMGELKTIGILRFLKKKKLIKKLEELLES
jgi:hypothetical protein